MDKLEGAHQRGQQGWSSCLVRSSWGACLGQSGEGMALGHLGVPLPAGPIRGHQGDGAGL